jgi:hypothetical protein
MLLGYRRDIACQTHRQHLLLRGGLGFAYRVSRNDKNIFQHKHPIRWHSSVHAMSQRYRNTKQGAANMIKVTFYTYSKVLKREFRNVEVHKSMDDARLRALALNWIIEKVEQA